MAEGLETRQTQNLPICASRSLGAAWQHCQKSQASTKPRSLPHAASETSPPRDPRRHIRGWSLARKIHKSTDLLCFNHRLNPQYYAAPASSSHEERQCCTPKIASEGLRKVAGSPNCMRGRQPAARPRAPRAAAATCKAKLGHY